MRYINSTKGRGAIAACCVARIFEAATICMALVICAMLVIDLIRRRSSRGEFIGISSQLSAISTSA
jgi:hypothetical protein